MGTRKISPTCYQGVVGSGGPGQTKMFRTRAQAAAWAAREAAKRGPLKQRRKYPKGNWMPRGVTYSNGKWYARSPVGYRPKVVRCFSDSVHGNRAMTMALKVARAWLKT